MIEVEVGDTIVEFPDGTAPDVMRSALQKRFGAPAGGPKTTTSGALGRGIANAATFNFYDELTGLARAGGLDENDPNIANAIAALAKGAYRKVTGAPDADRLYQEQRDKTRAETRLMEEEHPAASITGNVLGAVAVPVGLAARGATLGARAARGAIGGAGIGGVAGFGAGEGMGSSAAGAAGGAALGGAVGAAAPAVFEGAIQAARAVSRPIRSAVRGAVSPDTEAARRVVQAIDEDVRSVPGGVPGLTAQEFTGTPSATLVDLGGETTRALARSAANTSPVGRAALNVGINDRFEGQSGRVSDWLNRTFHYPNAQAQQEALEQTQRAANNAAYTRARQEGAEGIWSPELERLSGSGAVSAAMQRAAAVYGDEAIVTGSGAMNPRIAFTPDGRMQFNRGPTGIPTYPDLQYWDLVRRELSDAAQRAGRGTSESRRLESFARAMNAELDRIVPSYREARATAAGFFGAENALEAGQNFVRQNLNNRETRAAIARMSPTERQLFQDGFVSRLVETINNVGDRRSVLNKIADSPAAREKLEIALGRQRAQELEAMLRVEGIMDLARGAVQGNSTTLRQWVERGLAGGATGVGGIGVYNADPQTMTYAALTGIFLAGARRIDTRLARRVAEMLASNDPDVLRRGIQIVARSEGYLNSLRTADRRIVALGGQQSAQVPAIQAAGISRAEDEQPSVDRPIN